MVEWVRDLIAPIIKVIFIGGFVGAILFYVIRAFYNAWSRSWKFFLKYKIMRKPYNEKTMTWCVEAFERDLDYYDVKKLLYVSGMTDKNEILISY